MAESYDLCNSNFLQISKFLKIKRISDDSVRENGKKYFKIEWEDSWVEENEVRKGNEHVLKRYITEPKPKIEVFAHTENKEDNTQVIVLRVPSNAVSSTNTGDGNISIHGYEGAALVERLDEARDKGEKEHEQQQQQQQSPASVYVNNNNNSTGKAISYSQLEKNGFLDEDEEAETNTQQQTQLTHENHPTHFMITNNQAHNNNMVSTSKPPLEQLQDHQQRHQLGNENSRFLNYDVTTASMALRDNDNNNNNRRGYAQRRRQPFQLYKCNLCSSEFVHRTHLTIHKRTHTGEKPYKCEYCGRGFAQKGNLHVHQKIHTGEKDFMCEICHRAFITNAQLFVHMRTHTNPNKKRPHVTGRPVKHLDTPIKKETDSEVVNVSKSNMAANILVHLVPTEASSNTRLTTATASLATPHQTLSELPTSNEICSLQELASTRDYMGNLHALSTQNLQHQQQQSIVSHPSHNHDDGGIGKIGKTHHHLIPASLHNNMPIMSQRDGGGDSLYTMHNVSSTGLVAQSAGGDPMVQLLVAQP